MKNSDKNGEVLTEGLTKMLLPVPTQEEFEKRVSDMIPNGLRGRMARYMGKSESFISQQLSPHHERKSDIYRFLQFMWATDATDRTVGDALFREVVIERSTWLATDLRPHSASSVATGNIGSLYAAAVELELKGASPSDLLRAYSDMAEAVTEKLRVIQHQNAVKQLLG